jgi:hypothetical protein
MGFRMFLPADAYLAGGAIIRSEHLRGVGNKLDAIAKLSKAPLDQIRTEAYAAIVPVRK